MVTLLVDLQALDYAEATNVLKIPVETIESHLDLACKKRMEALVKILSKWPLDG